MSLAICANCTARYAAGLQKCPQCNGREPIEAWKVDNVEFTQADIDERRQRIADGVASDEDRRLVKLFDKGAVRTVPVQEASPATPAEVIEVLEPETYEGDAWTKEALQAELARRDLPTSGNKPELIERLLEDDKTPAESNVGEE